ncbi:MAG: NAD(P)H-dependent oxidoreductase [Allomuricauda sp.]
MKFIENQEWRYATKKFDPSQKVNNSDLQKLQRAVQLSASSYGLQLYKILVIEDPELRERLKAASWNQSQITDASHLFVFCNYTDRNEQHIDDYMQLVSDTQGTPVEDLKGYADFIKQSLSGMTDLEWHNWAEKQTYLALANLLNAAAELGIDACPMEGFEPDKYNEILGLGALGLNAALIAPIGYRSSEDHTQFRKKVRKPKELLFEMI